MGDDLIEWSRGAPHLFEVDEARKAPGAFLRALTELSALAEHTGTVRVRLVDNGFFANWLQVPPTKTVVDLEEKNSDIHVWYKNVYIYILEWPPSH